MEQGGAWEQVKRIWGIIGRLRGDPGCPWDKKQTPETVQTYLIEEAHEAAAAVRSGDKPEAAEELGDLLFMVFFMIHLYQEQNLFTLEEVAETICRKMIRRHPHVFGDVSVNGASEVRNNWEKIKAEEKKNKAHRPGGVPETLPALVRGYRLLSRHSQYDSQLNDAGAQARRWSSLQERFAEKLANGGVSGDDFGEVFLHLVNLARIHHFRAEDCLHEFIREGGVDSED